MKCKEIQTHLNDYIDGLLPAGINTNVAEHLNGCTKCRKEFEELNSIIEEAKLIPDEINPRHDFWEKISARIAASKMLNAKICSLDSIASNGNHYRLKFIPSKIYSGRRVAVAGSFIAALVAAILLFFCLNNDPGVYLKVETLAG